MLSKLNMRMRSTIAALLFAVALSAPLTLSLPQASQAAGGDVVVNNSSVNNDAYLDIQPGAGVEWLVHHVFHEHNIELYWYDGTNEFLIASPTGANYEWLQVRVTNSIYLRAKNKAGSTKRIGYDAVVTK